MSRESRLDRAIVTLESNLSDIRSVKQWAEVCGYDCPKRFSNEFLRRFAKRPKEVHVLVKMKWAVKFLVEQPDQICYWIGREVGHRDDKGLNCFLNSHLGAGPKAIREMKKKEKKRLINELTKRVEELSEKNRGKK